MSGLSSGEGVKWAVRDERIEDKEVVDAGVTDKSLLVIESEFAHALRTTARSGNTLSATIRESWDSGTLATLTKNDPVKATGAHIVLNLGDQFTDLEGGYAERPVKLPNPMYFLP